MRRFILGTCATALGVPLSIAYAGVVPAYGSVSSPHRPMASSRILVRPGQSIQAAINRARPGDTVVVARGVYHQDVVIQKNGITLRGSGDSRHGTVLMPPARPRRDFCNAAFGPTGVCVQARGLKPPNFTVRAAVRSDTVTRMYITGFTGNGVFGYGTSRLTVTRVTAVDDGAYGISRFASTGTLFAYDTAIGNEEAGFYVGDSPHADTVVRDNRAIGNNLGVFIRHARGIAITRNTVTGNCQGILVLDDGQPGGAGNAFIARNTVLRNNRLCPASGEQPFDIRGGGIWLLGATYTVVRNNVVNGNRGSEPNSGGIRVSSATSLFGGSNPNYDRIARNRAFGNQPYDLFWDTTGFGVRFARNICGISSPQGLCH